MTCHQLLAPNRPGPQIVTTVIGRQNGPFQKTGPTIIRYGTPRTVLRTVRAQRAMPGTVAPFHTHLCRRQKYRGVNLRSNFLRFLLLLQYAKCRRNIYAEFMDPWYDRIRMMVSTQFNCRVKINRQQYCNFDS